MIRPANWCWKLLHQNRQKLPIKTLSARLGFASRDIQQLNWRTSHSSDRHRTRPSTELFHRARATQFATRSQSPHEVQTLLDLDPIWQTLDVVSPDFIQWLHREFYQRLPEAFWQIEAITVEPEEWRSVNVQIGRHIPPPSETLPRFLDRFAQVYRPDQLSKVDQILAAAAAHHCFVWIHPFLTRIRWIWEDWTSHRHAQSRQSSLSRTNLMSKPYIPANIRRVIVSAASHHSWSSPSISLRIE